MIWPAECDDALRLLRGAREALGEAVDELYRLRATTGSVEPFIRAHEAVSWSVEHLADVLVTRSQRGLDADDYEVRHVDAQIFPWVDDL